jgi:iron complex transport system substrate-binding protein
MLGARQAGVRSSMSSPTSHDRLRIAALQPSISIILGRLDALDTLVACTRYCVEAVPALAQRPLTVVKDSWSCTTD